MGAVVDAALPPGNWVNVTGSLAGIKASCGSLVGVAAKPDEDFIIAGISAVGLYGSRDGGTTWQSLGGNPDAGTIVNRMSAILYDPQHSMTFWEAGIYGPSPFVTTDDGATFTQLGAISHTDLMAIDFSDPLRATMLAGGHEQAQTLYRSTNGGGAWTNIGASLPAKTNCTLPVLFDPQTYLVGCGGYGGGPVGIYRTTDGGSTWTPVSSSGGGAPPLVASDGTIYWASPNDAGLVRSSDNGVSWTTLLGPGVMMSSPPVELSGGRVAIMGTNYVIVSSDKGATWTAASPPFPMTPQEDLHGLAYSIPRHTFYVWHDSCGSGVVPVADDAIMAFSFQ